MSSQNKRPLEDDDPTIEEEVPDFDPTRTDQIAEDSFVSTRHDTTGVIEHDERGQARWVWTPETAPASESDATFDELRALTNDRLALEDSKPADSAPTPQSGYNPYDTNSPAPKPPKAQQPARKRR